MKPVTAFISAAAVVAVGVGGYFVWQSTSHERALSDLANRTRSEMIYVQGGTFMAGNYDSKIRLTNGEVAMRQVNDSSALPAHEVTLASYYLQANETVNRDFELFLKDQDLPQTDSAFPKTPDWPNHGASFAWHEARDYCSWLGTLSGLPLRLPTEAEWEYAARSRGQTPPWATDNGELIPGRNVPLSGRDVPMQDKNPPIRQYPSNPMGFYDMVAGLYEWVARPVDPNDQSIRFFKGGSNNSSLFGETIPGRGDANPTPVGKILTDQMFSDTAIKRRITAETPDVVHLGAATARCAASVPEPPAESGFGILPDMTRIDLPGPFGPYSPKGKYLGN